MINKKSNNKGFSLVELIIVIAIMAILASILAPALIKKIDASRESRAISNLKTVLTAAKERIVESDTGKVTKEAGDWDAILKNCSASKKVEIVALEQDDENEVTKLIIKDGKKYAIYSANGIKASDVYPVDIPDTKYVDNTSNSGAETASAGTDSDAASNSNVPAPSGGSSSSTGKAAASDNSGSDLASANDNGGSDILTNDSTSNNGASNTGTYVTDASKTVINASLEQAQAVVNIVDTLNTAFVLNTGESGKAAAIKFQRAGASGTECKAAWVYKSDTGMQGTNIYTADMKAEYKTIIADTYKDSDYTLVAAYVFYDRDGNIVDNSQGSVAKDKIAGQNSKCFVSFYNKTTKTYSTYYYTDSVGWTEGDIIK